MPILNCYMINSNLNVLAGYLISQDVSCCYDAAEFEKTCWVEKLLNGPDSWNKLTAILHRFWQEPFAVISDIDKMYHQVEVAENDQDVLRFVWRDNTE